mgnify:CR=1 FL=1
MGGGHVSRPDFGMPQPDAAYPLTEFYLLAQQALEKSGSFMLPALYAGLHSPAALLLTEECTRLTVAVQLLPPFVWEDPLPPLPDVPAALTLQLTMQDVMAIDTSPAALAQKLVHSTDGKCWLHHPKAETFLSERLALLQRVYK